MPSSIGISPLHTSHPQVLHGLWVRASTTFYRRFTLLMCSSPGFGSSPYDHKRPYQARFHYASGVRHPLGGHIDLTRRLVLQKARRHRERKRSGSDSLLALWFQKLFHPPLGVLFTFPSRYSFTIDLKQYLALEVSAPGFKRGFSGPALLEDHSTNTFSFRVRDFHPVSLSFPGTFC